MQYLGHISSKNFFIVDLKFKELGILHCIGNPGLCYQLLDPMGLRSLMKSVLGLSPIPHCLLVSVNVFHRL